MEKQLKGLITHSAIYWIGTIFAKLAGFLLIPVYTQNLSTAEYGTLELVQLSADVVGMLVGMQLSAAVFKYYHSREDKDDKNNVISTGIISILIAVPILFLIAFNVSENISEILFDDKGLSYLFQIMFFALFLGVMQEIPMTYLRIHEKSFYFVLIEVIQITSILVLNIFFVAVLEMSVFGAVLGAAITNAIIVPLLVLFVLKKVGLAYDLSLLKRMLAYSLPLVPATLGMFVLHFSDRYFLNHFRSLSEVGVYALAYKFGYLITNLVAQPFGLIWENKLFIFYKRKDRDELYNSVFVWLSFILSYAALGIGLFVEEVLFVVAKEDYWSASSIVPIIAFSYVFNALNLIFIAPLYVNKKTHVIALINSAAAILNVIMNYYFIIRFGILGAAVATLLSFAFILMWTIYESNKLTNIKWSWGRALKPLLLSAALLLIVNSLESDISLNYFMQKIAIFILFPIILIIIGFLKHKEYEFLKNKSIDFYNSIFNLIK